MSTVSARVARLVPVLGLVLALVAAPNAARAQAAPSRQSVRELLSGVEDAPSAAEWAALGPGAVAVLAAMHDDETEAPFVRLRTVWAARFYATDASRAFLSRVLLEDGLTRRTAILALAHAFGSESVAVITPFLSDPDVAVREGTISALGALDDADARAALRARIPLETDASLGALLRAVVAR